MSRSLSALHEPVPQSEAAPTAWHLARPWHTNTALLILGFLLLLLSRHLVAEFDNYTIGFSGTSGWSVWVYLAAVLVVLIGPVDRFTFPIILTVGITCRLSTLFADPILSSDVYRYVWDGVVQHAGINPYRYVPGNPALTFLREPNTDVFNSMNRRDYAHTIYPPFAQILFNLITFVSPTMTAMKTAMVLFEGVTLWALIRILHSLGVRREQTLIYAWCPLLIWEIAGSGHLDSAAMALFTLAILFRMRQRPLLTGLFLALAVLTKMYPLALFPVLYNLHPVRRVRDARTGRAQVQILPGFEWKMPALMLGLAVALYALYSSVGKGVFGFLGGYVEEEGMGNGTRFFLLEQVQHIPGLHNFPTSVYYVFCALVRFPAPRLLAGHGHPSRQAVSRRALDLRKGAMEDMVSASLPALRPAFSWKNRRVFLTGHTGFKGGWLALWLANLGADVRGYALDPCTEPNFFTVARVGSVVEDLRGDIRDATKLETAMRDFAPEVVFHLAAQPLVRYSYDDPIGTFETNVMGTARVLDAVRRTPSVRAVVSVTTDKCYENKEWVWPYRETDPLGGYDPYSSSKACAEIVSAAFRQSYFPVDKLSQPGGHQVAVATARAGNVIGGGDWSMDRLLPDLIRGFLSGKPVLIRRPHAIRPWQHVLEPLHGYIRLAECLLTHNPRFATAYNFGPIEDDARPVSWIAERMSQFWGEGASWVLDGAPSPHEAGHLKLDASRARADLGWMPLLRLDTALEYLVRWHRGCQTRADMHQLTLEQIQSYSALITT